MITYIYFVYYVYVDQSGFAKTEGESVVELSRQIRDMIDLEGIKKKLHADTLAPEGHLDGSRMIIRGISFLGERLNENR